MDSITGLQRSARVLNVAHHAAPVVRPRLPRRGVSSPEWSHRAMVKSPGPNPSHRVISCRAQEFEVRKSPFSCYGFQPCAVGSDLWPKDLGFSTSLGCQHFCHTISSVCAGLGSGRRNRRTSRGGSELLGVLPKGRHPKVGPTYFQREI